MQYIFTYRYIHIYIYNIYIYMYMFIYKDLPTISPEPQRPSGHQAERRGASARNSNGKAETSVELAEALVAVAAVAAVGAVGARVTS